MRWVNRGQEEIHIISNITGCGVQSMLNWRERALKTCPASLHQPEPLTRGRLGPRIHRVDAEFYISMSRLRSIFRLSTAFPIFGSAVWGACVHCSLSFQVLAVPAVNVVYFPVCFSACLRCRSLPYCSFHQCGHSPLADTINKAIPPTELPLAGCCFFLCL